MPVPDIINNTRSEMQKAVEYAQHQILKVRTGRASGSLVENLKIEYYGSPTPLGQVGSISTPDARTIMIQPWDRTTLLLRAADFIRISSSFGPITGNSMDSNCKSGDSLCKTSAFIIYVLFLLWVVVKIALSITFNASFIRQTAHTNLPKSPVIRS